MKPNDLSGHISKWFDGSGPGADIVISSRVRLARNLAGFEFLPCLSPQRKTEILQKLKDAILSLDIGENIFFVNMEEVSSLEQDLLVERHLISRQHASATGPTRRCHRRQRIIHRHDKRRRPSADTGLLRLGCN